MSETLRLLAQPVPVDREDGFDDSHVERATRPLGQTLIGDVVSQGVLERVAGLAGQAHLIEEFRRPEPPEGLRVARSGEGL